MAHFSPFYPESDIGHLGCIEDIGAVAPRLPDTATPPTRGEVMGVRSTAVTASLALLLCATLTSCTADQAPEQEVDDALLELERAADALSVTILRPGAERAFARKGHPVDGALSCASAVDPSAEPSEELAESEEDSVTASETGSADEAAEPGEAGQDTAEDAQGARGGRLEVLCTGQSRDGEEIRFEGRLLREALAGREEGDDSLRGAFTGLVGGDEVFTMDCFQCAPANSESPDAAEPQEDDEASESPADAE